MAGNQNQPVRVYTKQYANILGTVFQARAAFAQALAPVQILDGVQQNKKAFSVKTSGVPVVVGEYKTGADDVFGDGSGVKNRFGNLTEVIYEDTDVDYDYTLAIREGFDRHTVNNDLNAAVADRFKLQSEAQTRKASVRIGKHLSDAAGKDLALASLTDAEILKTFNKAAAYFTDTEVTAPVTVYVRQEIYNAIVDMAANTAAKGSSVSIDNNGVTKYKGFTIQPEAKSNFPTGTIALFVPNAIVIPFIGIQTARTIESNDFDGVELQAAAKGGQYTLEDNKKAIIKVTGTITEL